MFVFPSICYDLMDRLPYHILPIIASHVYLGVFVPGHARSYTLQNLSPGNYAIVMLANTEAGAGETGTMANVHIREDKLKWTLKVKKKESIKHTHTFIFNNFMCFWRLWGHLGSDVCGCSTRADDIGTDTDGLPSTAWNVRYPFKYLSYTNI